MKNKIFYTILVLVIIFLSVGCENDELYVDENNYETENLIDNDEYIEEEPIEEDSTNYQYIKYRDDMVDLSHYRWEYLDTSESSWINGAWYDSDEEYMIIDLNGTKYQYCGLPKNVWNKFRNASSFGSDYNSYIKGDYDCRINHVPIY